MVRTSPRGESCADYFFENMHSTNPQNPSRPVAVAPVEQMREKIRSKGNLKGRKADEGSREEVAGLIAEAAHRRDIFTETLHLLNAAYLGLTNCTLAAFAQGWKIPWPGASGAAPFCPPGNPRPGNFHSFGQSHQVAVV